MPKYKYFQDEKTMVWQRHAFTVTSESEAEADRIIHENELNQECVTNVYDDRIVFENTETLFDTQSRIEPRRKWRTAHAGGPYGRQTTVRLHECGRQAFRGIRTSLHSIR